MNETTERTQDQHDAHFMELALRQAEIAVGEGQTPFGAVVLNAQGHLIGEGHNRVRADLDPTAHGEVVAIRVAWRRLGAWPMLAGGTLYSSCEPCLLCSFVITQVGLRRVVFAARATLSGAAMDLAASVPSFGAGTSLWALALMLISIPRVFPLPVRLLGFFAAVLFGVTAVQIFAGIQVMPTTAPLPFYAYPVLVATLVGWIWTLMRLDALPRSVR